MRVESQSETNVRYHWYRTRRMPTPEGMARDGREGAAGRWPGSARAPNPAVPMRRRAVIRMVVWHPARAGWCDFPLRVVGREQRSTQGDPAPLREATPAYAGSHRLGSSDLDFVRRHCRHRQTVGVVPADARGEPCEARICHAPDGAADRVVDRDREVCPGAATDRARSNPHCQDDGLPLIHATRRGS